MDQMKKLAAQGRDGDTRVAHLTEGEVVIPREVAELRPDLIAHVAEQLRRMGGDPRQMVVGRGRVNPNTGIEEFATEEEVRAAYRQILGRDPDAEGLKYWMNDPGFSVNNLRIAAKPELIDQAYQQILGRQADEAGKKYWMNDGQYFDRNVFTIAAQPELAERQRQLQKQLDDMRREYERLINESKPPGGGEVIPPPGGSIIGGEVIPLPGGSIIGGDLIRKDEQLFYPQVIVYGPDGRAYASPREAIEAGVTNYSYSKPLLTNTPAGPGLISGADSLVNIPNASTGNVNNGALIASQNSQLFTRPTGIRLPNGVPNPFQG